MPKYIVKFKLAIKYTVSLYFKLLIHILMAYSLQSKILGTKMKMTIEFQPLFLRVTLEEIAPTKGFDDTLCGLPHTVWFGKALSKLSVRAETYIL